MRVRLILAFAIIILIALGTVLVYANLSAETQVRRYLLGSRGYSVDLMTSLQSFYREHGAWESVSEILDKPAEAMGRGQGKGQGGNQNTNSTPMHMNIILADPSGKILYAHETDALGTILGAKDLETAVPVNVDGKTVAFLLSPDSVSSFPVNFESQLVEKVQNAIITAALISGVVALILAVLLANQVVKPVKVLTKVAENMAKGDLSQRVSVKNYPEVTMLGDTLNKMAASLQSSEMQRRSMTADIAHELRTPLAVQQANLEALQDGVYPLTLDSIAPVLEQNRLLIRLVDDLRILALADSGELSLNRRPIDITELCARVAHRFEVSLASKGIRIAQQTEENMPLVNADPDRVEQILHNLLQNAQRYAPANSTVTLEIFRELQMVVISIRDEGLGIPSDELENIFERFYRVEKGRDRVRGGTGLGLAIARKLAEAHGGKLIATNHPEGGAVFSLKLPTL